MTTELIIFSAILVLSVILHLFFWLDSKKRYTDYLKRVDELNKRIKQLEESNVEMDKTLDEAEEAIDKIDGGIEDLRKGKILETNKTSLKN